MHQVPEADRAGQVGEDRLARGTGTGEHLLGQPRDGTDIVRDANQFPRRPGAAQAGQVLAPERPPAAPRRHIPDDDARTRAAGEQGNRRDDGKLPEQPVRRAPRVPGAQPELRRYFAKIYSEPLTIPGRFSGSPRR